MKTAQQWWDSTAESELWAEDPVQMIERIQRDAFAAGAAAMRDGAAGQVQRAVAQLPQTTISEGGVRAVLAKVDVEQLADHAFPRRAPDSEGGGTSSAGAA